MKRENDQIAYVGVDPGKSGVITIMKDKEFFFFEMPTHKVETGKFTKTKKPVLKDEFFHDGFRDLTFKIRELTRGYKLKVCIEDVGGRGGWSATNNFEFGYVAGMQKMIFIMLGAEINMVRAQKWQSYMRQGYSDIRKASSTGKTMISDPKAVAKMIVDNEYPHIDFRKTERAKNDDDNRIDSFLICMYCKRINS